MLQSNLLKVATEAPPSSGAFAFLGVAMTREQFEQSELLTRMYDSYAAYRRSLPGRQWVQLESGGWVTQPWPWSAA